MQLKYIITIYSLDRRVYLNPKKGNLFMEYQALQQVISSCIPVFLIIFLGWFCVKKGVLKVTDKALLSKLVSDFVFPALLFIQTSKAKPSEIFNGQWIVAFFAAMACIWLVTFITNKFVLGLDLKSSTMQSMLCSFPNMGGMGVPFLTLLLGASSTISVAVANFVVALTLIPITIFLLEYSTALVHGEKVGFDVVVTAVKGAVMKPMFLAVILGLIISLSNGYRWLPTFVFNSMDIMSDACNFISLLAVGVGVYGVGLKFNKVLVSNIALKCLVAPILAWLAIILFKINGMQAEELVFLLAMPTASTAVILAYKWNVQEEEASGIFLVSSVFSVILLPVLLLLLKQYIPGVM